MLSSTAAKQYPIEPGLLSTAFEGHASPASSAEWNQSSSASRSNREPRNRPEPGTTFLPSSPGQTFARFVPKRANELQRASYALAVSRPQTNSFTARSSDAEHRV